MTKHYANKIINDIDKHLMNFYYLAQNDMSTLFEVIIDNRGKTEFDDVKKFRYELDNEQDDYIRAFKYYSCVYCGYGGKPYASPTRDKFNQYKKNEMYKKI